MHLWHHNDVIFAQKPGKMMKFQGFIFYQSIVHINNVFRYATKLSNVFVWFGIHLKLNLWFMIFKVNYSMWEYLFSKFVKTEHRADAFFSLYYVRVRMRVWVHIREHVSAHAYACILICIKFVTPKELYMNDHQEVFCFSVCHLDQQYKHKTGWVATNPPPMAIVDKLLYPYYTPDGLFLWKWLQRVAWRLHKIILPKKF